MPRCDFAEILQKSDFWQLCTQWPLPPVRFVDVETFLNWVTSLWRRNSSGQIFFHDFHLLAEKKKGKRKKPVFHITPTKNPDQLAVAEVSAESDEEIPNPPLRIAVNPPRRPLTRSRTVVSFLQNQFNHFFSSWIQCTKDIFPLQAGAKKDAKKDEGRRSASAPPARSQSPGSKVQTPHKIMLLSLCMFLLYWWRTTHYSL
jgi:hypothetical protein